MAVGVRTEEMAVGVMPRLVVSARDYKLLEGNDLNLPLIHHIEFPKGIHMDDLVNAAGTNAGALLVDGFGEGLLLEAPEQYFDFLRNTCFNLLQEMVYQMQIFTSMSSGPAPGKERKRKHHILLFYSNNCPIAQFTELNALVTPVKSQVADESGIDKTMKGSWMRRMVLDEKDCVFGLSNE
ncbi:hypothetical protein LguiA_029434 [Lonicera macranthoides]